MTERLAFTVLHPYANHCKLIENEEGEESFYPMLDIGEEELVSQNAMNILEDVTQNLKHGKPIKRAGSKRRRSSALTGLVDGKIPVLGSGRRPSEDLGTGRIESICNFNLNLVVQYLL